MLSCFIHHDSLEHANAAILGNVRCELERFCDNERKIRYFNESRGDTSYGYFRTANDIHA